MVRSLICVMLADPSRAPVGSAESPLELRETVSPSLRADGVRISVQAASLNFADLLICQGLYQERPKLPFVAGGEVAGVVLECGSSVHDFRPGDRVLAVLPRFGGLSSEVCAASSDVFLLPPKPSFREAAGLAVAYGTAHVALRHRCRLQAGQSVLVLGAAGGVGIAAVQIAKAVGARVAAVCRGEDKCAALRHEGADLVLNSESVTDLRSALRSFAPRGVDVLFDPVGGEQSREAMRTLAWGANVAIIGFASGDIPQLAANVLLVKNLTVHGIYWGSHSAHQPEVIRESLAELLRWAGEGTLRVRVSHALPFERAHEAFRALAERRAVGKVVLLPPGSSEEGNGQASKL